MNWENYDRLVHRLKTMPAEMFDYFEWKTIDGPGCLDCQCRILMGDARPVTEPYFHEAIRKYLGVKESEAEYLWQPSHFQDPNNTIFRGEPAIGNALYRLNRVAAEYERTEMDMIPADKEQQFLQSCRAIACQPLEPESVAG